jgi:hypothetical protein
MAAEDDPIFNQVIAVSERMDIKKIMGFRLN